MEFPADFWHINIGQVVNIAAMLFGGIAGVVAMLKSVWTNRSLTTENTKDIGEIKEQIVDIKGDVKEIRGMLVNSIQAANSDRNIATRRHQGKADV